MGRIKVTVSEGKANKKFPDRLLRVIERGKAEDKADLAYKVDALSVGAWSRWFKVPPTAYPNFRTLYRFALLGVNLNWLVFNGVGEPEMRNDALPLESSIDRVRQTVIDRIRNARSLSKSVETSIPTGDAFVKLIEEAIRKNLGMI